MRLNVVLTGLPKDRFASCGLPGVQLGKQSGKLSVDMRPVGSPTHTIAYDVEVRPNKRTGAPDFYGPEVFGTAERRFLYAQWASNGAMFRRLKIDLGGISPKQALAGKPLTVEVAGVAKDGGPACATASMGKWEE